MRYGSLNILNLDEVATCVESFAESEPLQNYSQVIVHPAEQRKLPPPILFDGNISDHQLLEYINRTYSTPPIKCFYLQSVYGVGNGLLINQDNDLLVSPSLHSLMQPSKRSESAKLAAWQADISFDGTSYAITDTGKRIVFIDEPAILLCAPWSGGYGHFLIDILPKIQVAIAAGVTALQGKKWILDRSTCSAVHEILELLEIPEADVIWIDRTTEIFFYRELYVPSRSRHGRSVSRVSLPIYQQIVERTSKTQSPIQAEKIFISRGSWAGNKRPLLEREQLEAAMQQLGFEIVHPQNFSFKEQVQIFRQAKWIIGERGSALYSILFSSASSNLIVLENNKNIILTLSSIADWKGMNIGYYFGKGLQEFENVYTGSYHVDVADFVSVLEPLLEASTTKLDEIRLGLARSRSRLRAFRTNLVS